MVPEMSQWSHVTGGVDLSSMVCNAAVGQWERAAQLSTATCSKEEQPAPRSGLGMASAPCRGLGLLFSAPICCIIMVDVSFVLVTV